MLIYSTIYQYDLHSSDLSCTSHCPFLLNATWSNIATSFMALSYIRQIILVITFTYSYIWTQSLSLYGHLALISFLHCSFSFYLLVNLFHMPLSISIKTFYLDTTKQNSFLTLIVTSTS